MYLAAIQKKLADYDAMGDKLLDSVHPEADALAKKLDALHAEQCAKVWSLAKKLDALHPEQCAKVWSYDPASTVFVVGGGRWKIALHKHPPSSSDLDATQVVSATPLANTWSKEPSGHTVNESTILFPPANVGPLGESITHASIFDLDRQKLVAIVPLPGGGGHLYYSRAVSIDRGCIRFLVDDEVKEPVPAPTPAWKAWREVLAQPGECPCGVPRSVCTYHRDAA